MREYLNASVQVKHQNLFQPLSQPRPLGRFTLISYLHLLAE